MHIYVLYIFCIYHTSKAIPVLFHTVRYKIFLVIELLSQIVAVCVCVCV